ncbi:MAG: tetratricopeptide repeat protein [Cyclobacteriaceae bacterium]
MRKILVLILAFITISGFSQSKKIDSLQLLVQKESNVGKKAFLLNELSTEFRNTDFKKSIEFAEQALVAAKQAGDVKQLGRAQLYIGVENYYLGKYDEALKAYLAALKIYDDSNDKRGMATVLNELGTFNKKQGDVEESQKNFEQALSLSKEINDSSQIGNSMNNLGIIYEMKEDFTKAMDYFKKSAVIKEAMNDLNGVSYNYDNMGEDNGRGFNAERLTQSHGNGWKNINSRLHLIKGTIEIDSQEGRANTTVIISVPSGISIAV